jgi:hypothetical protein
MGTCDQCIEARDALIKKLATYSALLQAERDHLWNGDLEAARIARDSATKAGEEVTAAKGALNDHDESYH